MARLLKAVNPGASYDLLLAATEKYGRSLEHNPNNPQARHLGCSAGPPMLRVLRRHGLVEVAGGDEDSVSFCLTAGARMAVLTPHAMMIVAVCMGRRNPIDGWSAALHRR